MLSNKKVFTFLTILSLFGEFLVFNETCVCFLILHCITYTSYTSYTSICPSNLFWDCANSIVNIFSVHNDFNATNNFFKFSMQFCGS